MTDDEEHRGWPMSVNCSHGYPVCRHGKCDMECGEPACASTADGPGDES